MTTKYLKRRTHSWNFRIRVPKALQGNIGKAEIIEPLGTTDLSEAQELRWPRVAYWQGEFARLKREAVRQQHSAPWEVFQETTKAFDGVRDEFELFEVNDTAQDTELEYNIYRGDGQDGEDASPLPPALQAKVDATKYTAAKLRGETTAIPITYQLPFLELAKKYTNHLEKNEAVNIQTIRMHNTVYRLFSAHVDNKPLSLVSKGDVASFVDVIQGFDPNWGKWPDAQYMPLADIVRRSKGCTRGLSYSTVSRYLSSLISLWKWANRRDYVAGHNPFTGMAPEGKRSAGSTYIPYTVDELNTLFKVPGKRMWLWEVPLVALFSGMRQNEIASLEWTDIKQEDGIWFFDITASKSDAGIRVVPIHSSLSWLIERRIKKVKGYIWSSLTPTGPDKKMGQYVSKEFGKLRTELGLTRSSAPGVPNGSLAFHSFRKNVIQCFERARIPENEAAEIVGHKKAGITYRVYNPEGMTMLQRQEIVENIKYPGLDLTELMKRINPA